MTIIKTKLGTEDSAHQTRFSPEAGFTATNVQDAIVEAKTDSNDASEISFTPDGSIAATNVQDAIVEVRDDADAAIAAAEAASQPVDDFLTSIATLGTAADKGIYTTAADTAAEYDLTAYGRSIGGVANEAAFKALVNLEIGTDVQAFDADLSAVAALSSTGLVARTGAGAAAVRTLTGPAAGITVSSGDGVSGNPTLALADDLAALEGLASTGLVTRTGDGTATTRAVTAGTGISVSNGDGVSGAPTVTLANTAVTPGSYTNASITVDQQGRLTAASSGSSLGGSWVLLSSVAASSSATVNLETGFGATYDTYVAIWDTVVVATDAVSLNSRVKMSGSYVSSSDYNYVQNSLTPATTTATSGATGATSFIVINNVGNASSEGTSGQLMLFGSNSSRFKHMRYESVSQKDDGVFRIEQGGCSVHQTAAVQGIQFFASSGNIASGNFYLFGIKKS